MDPLDKLELIIEGTINQKKEERERGKDKHSNLYVLRLIRGHVRMIKRNAPSMADEVVTKMYG